MNGAVYISFFQGQLESVLEQVVQFAVQEISTTVGTSLNSLLLETTVKEQENQRLRVQLQSQEKKKDDVDGAGETASVKRCEEVETGGTKPEHRQQQRRQQRVHAPGGRSTESRCHTDTRRLEQRGRVVGQLKSVMEKVLNFAVCELTKIVEASFDDLLLEITKMETEQQILEEKLDKKTNAEGERGGGGGRGAVVSKRRGSENDSVSPSGSEDAREDQSEVPVIKETTEAEDSQRSTVLSVSQEWFPILDKVFGQKWCSDVLQIKELASEGGAQGEQQAQPPVAPSVNLQPAPSSPQQDPRWTPLEDMEVFSSEQPSPDATADTLRNVPRPAPSPKTNLNQSADGQLSGEGSCRRRSSASMLHRLLTLPSQLLEEDDAEEAGTTESLVTLGGDGAEGTEAGGPKDEEEEVGEEDKGRKKKRRRVWSECDECGRSFSRISLLKAHRQTHLDETTAGADGGSSASPHASATSPLSCSNCGKRFSSVTRLQSHIHTQHPAHQS